MHVKCLIEFLFSALMQFLQLSLIYVLNKSAVEPRSPKSKTCLPLNQRKNGGYQNEERYFVVSSIFHCGNIEKLLKHISDIHYHVCLNFFLIFCFTDTKIILQRNLAVMDVN